MSESKSCPKCSGTMTPGRLQKVGNFGNSPYVWAPEGEPSFPMKGAPSQRCELVAYCCQSCAFLEWYAVSGGG